MPTPPDNDRINDLLGTLCPAGLSNPSLDPEEHVKVRVGNDNSGYDVFATPKDPTIRRGLNPRCSLNDNPGVNACGLCQRRVLKTPYMNQPK